VRRVYRARRNVAARTRAKRFRLAIHGQRHLSIQDDVRRLDRMRVVSVSRARHVFPNVGVRKTLAMKLIHQFLLIHAKSVTRAEPVRNRGQTRKRPPCRNGGCCRKGVPSSGEKIVYLLLRLGLWSWHCVSSGWRAPRSIRSAPAVSSGSTLLHGVVRRNGE